MTTRRSNLSEMRGFPVAPDCPKCGERMVTSRFDVTARDAATAEHLFFGVPASACPNCSLLAVEKDVERLFGIRPDEVVSAIESDAFLRARGLDAA